MPQKNLTQLIKKASAGDSSAFREIYELKWKEVHFVAYKMTGDFDAAQDVAQEVFLKVFKNINQLSKPKAFNSWLYQIVRTTCMDRGKSKTAQFNDRAEDLDDYTETVRETREEFLPEDALNRQEDRDALLAIVNNLNEKYRLVILLFYYKQMSCEEISKASGVSVSAVKVRLQRARVMIKEQFEAHREKGGRIKAMAAMPILSVLFQDEASFLITDAMKFATLEKIAAELAAGGVVISTAVTAASTTSASAGASTGVSVAAKAVLASVASVAVVGTGVTAFLLQENPPESQTSASISSSSSLPSLSVASSESSSVSEEPSSSSSVSSSSSESSVLEVVYPDNTLEGILGYDNAQVFLHHLNTLTYETQGAFREFVTQNNLEKPVTYFFPVGDTEVYAQFRVYTKAKGDYVLYICEQVNDTEKNYDMMYRIDPGTADPGEPDLWNWQ